MEYCEGGDLAQFLKKLKKEKEEFPEEVHIVSNIGYMEDTLLNNISFV